MEENAVPQQVQQNLRATDIYLQPHSDDICFSLGAFAAKRQHGLIITVFPIASWVHPAAIAVCPSHEVVTALRMAEDRNFASDAGLAVQFMDLPGASNLGWKSFDLSRLTENRRRVHAPLMEELRRIAHSVQEAEHPWLFCPAGIGGHVDHAAVRDVVIANAAELSRSFRIAFYEDLHYASDLRARISGLAGLFARSKGAALTRWNFPLDESSIRRKCMLIAHYPSQIRCSPADLAEYSPATMPSSPPHEAVWTLEQAPEHFTPADGFEAGRFLGRRLATVARMALRSSEEKA